MDLTGIMSLHKKVTWKQFLLRFFALFTQVKGISNSVKRRAYLDFILKGVQKVPGKSGRIFISLLSEKWRFIRS